MLSTSGYQRLSQEQEELATQAQVEATNKGIITRPLSKELSIYYSSGDYADLLCSVLSPADVLSTWGPRYSGVLESILSGSGQIGSFIEYTSQDPMAAIVFYLAVGIAASKNFYDQYQLKKAAENAKRDTHLRLLTELKLEKKVEEDKTLEIADYNDKVKSKIDKLNAALKQVVENDPAKKYKSITYLIEFNNLKAVYEFTPEAHEKPSFVRKFFNKVTNPLYSGLVLASFTYWILFITSAVTVGTFAAAGIAGVAPIVGFGIPLLMMTPYFGIKIRNYFKNREGVSDEHARLNKIIDDDESTILKAALDIGKKESALKKYESEVNQLEEENARLATELKEANPGILLANMTPMPSLRALGVNKYNQALAAGYTTTIAQVGLTQYASWIIADFLKVVPVVALSSPLLGPIVGGALVAIGLGLGIKEGYDKYQAAKKLDESETKLPTKPVDLAVIFNDRLKRIGELNDSREEQLKRYRTHNFKAPSLSSFVEQKFTPPAPMSSKKLIYNFFDLNTTGIFFGRLFFTAGTAIFLPFAPLILAPPIAIGILAISGLAFAAAKYYQAKQAQTEAHAKEYVAKINEMDQQIHIAELTNRNFELDIKNKLNHKSAEQAPPSSPLASPQLGQLFSLTTPAVGPQTAHTPSLLRYK